MMYSRDTERLVSFMGYGKENAVKRRDLVNALGVSDRTARDMIEDAKREGVPICNDQDGVGYFIGNTVEELSRQFRQNRRRGKSIMSYQRAITSAIEAIDQMKLYDLMKENA